MEYIFNSNRYLNENDVTIILPEIYFLESLRISSKNTWQCYAILNKEHNTSKAHLYWRFFILSYEYYYSACLYYVMIANENETIISKIL